MNAENSLFISFENAVSSSSPSREMNSVKSTDESVPSPSPVEQNTQSESSTDHPSQIEIGVSRPRKVTTSAIHSLESNINHLTEKSPFLSLLCETELNTTDTNEASPSQFCQPSTSQFCEPSTSEDYEPCTSNGQVPVFLLPNKSSDFSRPEYWNTFFKKRGKEPFEWYGDYMELVCIVHKYVKPMDKILMIGCGNSTISNNMYDVGYHSIMNIDLSDVAIKHMKQKYTRTRPGLEYVKMDVFNMTFDNKSFSVVFDKGTLDALFPNGAKESRDKIAIMFDGVDRLLRVGGRYICITLLQTHVFEFIMDYFMEKGWIVRICRCDEVDRERRNDNMPVFAVVCTKINHVSGMPSILELAINDKNVRRISRPDLKSFIKATQRAEMVCSGLHRNIQMGPNFETEFIISAPIDGMPRYTVRVLDKKYATIERAVMSAFIVPFGKNEEFPFNSVEGRRMVMKSAKADRICFIYVHPNNPATKNLNEEELNSLVQDDLNDIIVRFAPERMVKNNEKILYMTMGKNMIKEETLYEGKTGMSGNYIIQRSFNEEGHMYRRLVFKNRINVIQSEVRILPPSTPGGDDEIDFNYISNDYHVFVNVALMMEINCVPKEHYNTLMIGFGGGVLSQFIHACFEKIYTTAVEIDPAIYDLAMKFFCHRPSERLEVIVQDGLEFLEKADEEEKKYDAIIFDVDNKDPSSSLTCPPVEFVEQRMLQRIKRIMNPQGLFILNVGCRIKDLNRSIMKKLMKLFAGVLIMKNHEDVNEIVVCWMKDFPSHPKACEIAVDEFQKCALEKGISIRESLFKMAKEGKFAKGGRFNKK